MYAFKFCFFFVWECTVFSETVFNLQTTLFVFKFSRVVSDKRINSHRK
jgi:hypothetical protein